MLQDWQLQGGVLVERVQADRPGARAGLVAGDVIVQLGYTAVNSVADYQRVVEKLPANSLLPIRIYRQGRAIFRTITIPN